ncbi:MAG: sulfite exporter TauE/SafE family protein [Pseudomonadota bacterium]
MDLTFAFYAVAAAAVVVTGISKSGFAGGLGVMSVPLLLLFVEPAFALAVMMPILVVMDGLIVWRYRRQWDRETVATLVPGAVAGIAIGAATFTIMPASLIAFLVGLLALAFVAQFFLRAQSAEPPAHRRGVAFGLGALSGFAGYIAHAGGPPVKGYLLSRRFDKTVFVGTNAVYISAVNGMKAVGYAATGIFSTDSLMASLIVSPLLFVGVGLGLLLHKIVDQQLFMRIVYALLAVAGVKLIWDSVSVWVGA